MYGYKCETCTDTFSRQDDCERHMDDYNHWPECETCPRTFRIQRACDQHMNDLEHWAPGYECETCTKEFGSQIAANQHMTAVGHWTPHLPCETCGKKFHTQNAANQHMEKLAHYKAYCQDCKIHFQNKNNLKMVRLPKLVSFSTNKYSISTQRFTEAPRSYAPSAREITRPLVALLTTSRQVHALVPLKLTENLYSV